MTARIAHTTVDSRDAHAQSLFWAAVLGFAEDPDDPNEPGHEECLIASPDGGTRLLFIEVPEPKTLKNRLHLDLEPVEGSRDDEVARVQGLGAQLVEDRRRPDGTGWAVLTDPEGNEFCVLRSPAERAAAG
jgi:predicted enzyme related to lactoylglutathione lyase